MLQFKWRPCHGLCIRTKTTEIAAYLEVSIEAFVNDLEKIKIEKYYCYHSKYYTIKVCIRNLLLF